MVPASASPAARAAASSSNRRRWSIGSLSSEYVGELVAVGHHLEALHERGVVAVHAGERRRLPRVVEHERGAHQLVLDELVVHLVCEPARAPGVVVGEPESVEHRVRRRPPSRG